MEHISGNVRNSSYPRQSASTTRLLTEQVGRSWLATAKIARKAGQWQTAYSAMLQAEQNKAPYSFLESAKLMKATGEPLRGLHHVENALKSMGLTDDVTNILDLTEAEDSERTKRMNAKVSELHV